MKLEFDKAWFDNRIRQDEDFEVGAGVPTNADEREEVADDSQQAENTANFPE